MITPKDQISADGVPSDGVGHTSATPEQRAKFENACDACGRGYRSPGFPLSLMPRWLAFAFSMVVRM